MARAISFTREGEFCLRRNGWRNWKSLDGVSKSFNFICLHAMMTPAIRLSSVPNDRNADLRRVKSDRMQNLWFFQWANLFYQGYILLWIHFLCQWPQKLLLCTVQAWHVQKTLCFLELDRWQDVLSRRCANCWYSHQIYWWGKPNISGTYRVLHLPQIQASI